jgi:hypothetical protein
MTYGFGGGGNGEVMIGVLGYKFALVRLYWAGD